MMQGQSSRPKKSPISTNSEFHISNPQDEKDVSYAKMIKLGLEDFIVNDFPLSAPSCEIELDQDDDMIRWLNCPLDEPLRNDYSSAFLPELSEVTLNDISTNQNLASFEKRVALIGNVHSNASYATSSASELTRIRPEKSDINSNFVVRDSFQSHSLMACLSSKTTQKQDEGYPVTSFGFMNFSHFSKPVALARANLHALSSNGRPVNGNEGGTMNFRNPTESTLVNLERDSYIQRVTIPTGVNLESSSSKPIDITHSEDQAACLNDIANKSQSQALYATVSKPGEKAREPAATTSSVCSGNSMERASNDPTRDLKRKSIDTGESEGPSEEVEEESVGVRKAAPARTGSKRSRAAEVHNLSERRRRDRINEKMRALQELIPNCNKVDKASMLDEAIEYLKTLQLQVQILSMGAGLYMHPMIFPSGMQHIHGAHMPYFSSMTPGTGTGIGTEFHHMLDFNGGMTHLPPSQGSRYPVPDSSVAGSSLFPGIRGSSFPVFAHPCQGLPMSMPRPPAAGLNLSGVSVSVDPPRSVPPSGSKDAVQNVGLQATPNNDVNLASDQSTKDAIEQSSVRHDQGRDANGTEASNIAIGAPR